MTDRLSISNEKKRVKEAIAGKLRRHFGRSIEDATERQLYNACALTLRDEIMERWADSVQKTAEQQSKQVYYLSVEFLMGRALGNNLMNMLKDEVYQEALLELGVNMGELREVEPDAGLGNGGLGRLAACFLDSLATLGFPGHGYGIRYQYGLFKQKIVDGFQIEMPDPWLDDGNVWEIARAEEQRVVRFGGRIAEGWEGGRKVFKQEGYMSVIAIPYDTPIVGYGSRRINTLRLWSAKSPKYLDMSWFGRGDYIKATAEKELAEVISKVLYPEDNHYEGKALRLKQHYFFVSASIQCILENFTAHYSDLRMFPDKVAIHINDTHPALAIPELMRLLIDQEGLDWDSAWDITTRTFAYTNHTILGEALERWPQNLFKELLPRIHMIVHEINEHFCKELWNHYPGQWERISELAVIAYDEIRMAPLCIAGSHSVNGVAALHTNILKNDVFKYFYQANPNKFTNITNGITQRRWLLKANPGLSKLLHDAIGDEWILKPWELKKLQPFAEDAGFREDFRRVKGENKERLARCIKEDNGIMVDTASIFDVQVKRLHEYKRQLLNILHVLYLYNRLISNPKEDFYPRTFIFGAKASPGYHRAKQIIKLIHTVAERINRDKRIDDRIKVLFMENYRVSLAEKIIPATDISEQISTAGKEASGTGNMKFMINGALTVGTLDGANIEIRDAVGEENIFIFGLKAEEVASHYHYGDYQARKIYEQHQHIKQVLDQMVNGFLDPEGSGMFADIYRSLLYGDGGIADPYFVLADFESFSQAQEQAEQVYRDREAWSRKAIINVANAGYFSSDRSIMEYNEKIWGLRSETV